MKTTFAWALAVGLLAVAAAAPARASSLPRVDFGTRPLVGLGIGTNQGLQAGGSLSFDLPLAPMFMIGAAGGYNLGGSPTYDVRAVYRLVQATSESPTIAGIFGLWGAPGVTGFQLPGSIAPIVGFGLSYAFLERFDVRLDLVYSPFFNYGQEAFTFLGGPPGSGVELGYRLRPGIEATVGFDGRGDVLGLSMAF